MSEHCQFALPAPGLQGRLSWAWRGDKLGTELGLGD